ncbi:MAG: DUF6159 family protein [bacterium]|nr:DUF6159 family protein [bacterium]
MLRKIQNGAQLSAQSWQALRENPQLLIFPLLSLIASLLVTVVFFIPLAGTNLIDISAGREDPSILTLIVLFLYYVANYTVIIFSNTALIAAASKAIRGEKPTVRDGLDLAMSRLGKILPYAIISATVGMVARSISQSGRRSNNPILAILAAILGSLLQGAWNILVFFAIPVLVYENVGVVDGLKRSFQLFRQTWGESFTGSTVIGGISCLLYGAVMLIGAVLIGAAFASGSVALSIAAVVVVVLAILALGLLSGAVNGVFQASMYLYATTGDAGQYVDTELARQAFGGVQS